MKAVVTGATGFLGSVLVRELVNNGDEVTALVRSESERIGNLEGLGNLRIVEQQLDKPFTLSKDEGFEVFFHLAWGGKRNDFDGQYLNLGNTVNCLKAAEAAGCRRFVCTGSQAEYGETADPITEETALKPVTAYGAVKAAAYHLSAAFTGNTNMDLVWARVFSVYGEHDDPHTLYSRLIDSLKSGRDFELSTDGTHIWNYLYETDAARMLRMLSDVNIPPGVYNVASKTSRPLIEYVLTIRDRMCPGARITFGKEKCPVNLNADTGKLRSAIGRFEEHEFAEEINE